MVYRIFVEKKEGLDNEAKAVRRELRTFLQIQNLDGLRLLNRYDVEGISEELFERCRINIFSEPQQDVTYENIDTEGKTAFAVEYLPGQFDQRADSAAQCIQLLAQVEKPAVRSAKVYILEGDLSAEDVEKIKKHLINPVEAREASMDLPESLDMNYEIPSKVATVEGFNSYTKDELSGMISTLGLAMDLDDILFCQEYFRSEHRDPTITEIRMIDTYWSDHCRHTTFLTTIDNVEIKDKIVKKAYEEYLKIREKLNRTKPVNLMDIATLAGRYLSKEGYLPKLDESEEINACTVKINIEVDGKDEEWLLLFKNETHNHPTEIEPFGGAATCIGGAIRDPLSGRSYVYAAMRVTGASDPVIPVERTMQGKLPQRKIVTTAAQGYSSYGNQIGLATGQVDEIYHPGYTAKHMEIGAVLGAAPRKNVRREVPCKGDVVILLGGRTGRDGIGGATGSSKSHTLESLETCGAEVQKGNAPEERKLQRLFRNGEVSRLIKRCNDFGAGGVSVAIGELADGLEIDLDAVPKKYEGLDGTEIAISESQERMAVVVAPEDEELFKRYAFEENLEATKVAVVTDTNRLVMNWNGDRIVDISRDFLNSNGAEKHIDIAPEAAEQYRNQYNEDFRVAMLMMASDLNVCSKRGLSERFDSTIGAGSVLMPFGGRRQMTPIQAMVHKIPVEKGHTDDCSFMAWGYNPMVSEKSPYHGAYLAVVESISKLIATGASFDEVYLTFQEYFEKPFKDGKRWGKPFAALLGAFKAQIDLKVASIGGKDSMSGTFEDIDVPPTLVSFAVTMGKTGDVLSNHFKKAGSKVYFLAPDYDRDGLPEADSLKKLYKKVTSLIREKKALSCYTPGFGGIAEAVFKMSLGEGFGFRFSDSMKMEDIFGLNYGGFVIESDEEIRGAKLVGEVTSDESFDYKDQSLDLKMLTTVYEEKLESVYACNTLQGFGLEKDSSIETKKIYTSSRKIGLPRVLIPVFPGTNCEYDTARAWNEAGVDPEIFVINNLSADSIKESAEKFAEKINDSQIIFIPGGFSGGDEPDGSGKFITAFFRNEAIKDNVMELLNNRDGLMAGICNGFQALIKLGLVPFGKILDGREDYPTLTYNTIGRHQSKIVRTKLVSDKSPWLMEAKVGEVYSVPISHGEGRFIAPEEVLAELEKNGQVITRYVDFDNRPSMDIRFNPNGSMGAVEGIISMDGRVLGKMGHSERVGKDLYLNVEGNYDLGLFRSAVRYFR